MGTINIGSNVVRVAGDARGSMVKASVAVRYGCSHTRYVVGVVVNIVASHGGGAVSGRSDMVRSQRTWAVVGVTN